MNLKSDIIYSPILGTSADVPDVPCRTPLALYLSARIHVYYVEPVIFHQAVGLNSNKYSNPTIQSIYCI